MNNYKHVFSPFTIKNVEFKNRLETAPQATKLATSDGYVTTELIDYYRPYARGGFGIVTIGDSAVDWDYAPSHDLSINLGNENVITGLSELVETITRFGAQISIELSHGGRNSLPRLLKGKNPIAPSPIPNAIEMLLAARQNRLPHPVDEINEDQIADVVQHFAEAAFRCQAAGFNMVMLHGGHGHLFSQFLSPYSNKRKDKYGGNLENRARFALAVLEAIRKKCGNGLVIEYRISLDEKVDNGMKPEENIEFLKIIESMIDIVNVSAGIMSEPSTVQHMIQPLYTPHMYNVRLAELTKKHINLPVTAVGSIMNLDNAETILANGWADLIAFARPALADPEMPRKAAKGLKSDIRPCIRCNVCTSRSGKHMNHRCSINPMAGRGSEFNENKGLGLSRKKKKVLIAGGGPAGMQAAQTATERGHKVVLYEMSDHLGGMMATGCELDFKKDLKAYHLWMVAQTKKCGAKIILNTEVTAKTVAKERPDVLIIAVGAAPIIPEIPGINSKKVCWAGDVDTGKVKTGRKIVVVGAGLTGVESAVSLASQGKDVTIIEMLGPQTLLSEASSAHKYYLLDRIKEYNIRIIMDTKLESITEKGINVTVQGDKSVDYEADTVILAMGLRPRKEKVTELRRLIPETEVFVVGDCVKPRSIFSANHEAFNVVCEL
jgi:2,4-dienoyl-CoA reductase-like NADH-dependent reductase (Old Yellow Enzyme family)/thioredoxin reductase